MTPKTSTIAGLGKLLSLEFLVLLVMIGVSWGTLTSKVAGIEDDVSAAEEKINSDTAEQKAQADKLSSDINQINRKVDVLGNEQKHFRMQAEIVNRRLEKIQDLLEHPTKQER